VPTSDKEPRAAAVHVEDVLERLAFDLRAIVLGTNRVALPSGREGTSKAG
jgi:hypothetical protein